VDLNLLPTVFTLTVFVAAFRPLVRRAGSHTNLWFLGWAFLLLHYVAIVFTVDESTLLESLRVLVAIWSTELCGLCFVLAATRSARFSRVFTIEIGVPILIQSGLYAFDIDNNTLRLAATLLLVIPAIHLVFVPRNRNAHFNWIAGLFTLLAAGLLPFPKLDPYIALDIILGVLYLSAAYLTFAYAPKLTRGIFLTVSGLTLWALSYPLQAVGLLAPEINLNRTLLDLPRYIVAVGMILSLLDEYLNRTENLALHDPLTGLPNRRLFEIRLDQAIEESRHTHIPIACLVIDVDNFKHINDSFGHPVGDGLLQALATRLSWNLGPRDMLARTGGDEFAAILIEAADEYNVRFVAGAMLASGCVPVSIQNHLIDVRISIGIAVSSRAIGNSAELHRCADEAMYRAKRRGGSNLAFTGEELPMIHTVSP